MPSDDRIITKFYNPKNKVSRFSNVSRDVSMKAKFNDIRNRFQKIQ